jgi:septum formation protein
MLCRVTSKSHQEVIGTLPSGTALVPTLILASASPRRHELLAQLGIPFTVIPANIDEQHISGEPPEAYVIRMARTKAQCIAPRQPGAFVLGADTIVVCESQILGKPQGIAQARQTLLALSGRQHTVITALALCQYEQGFVRVETVPTQVWFRPLSMAEIERYIATEEPFDKAGAYAIQGAGAAFVAGIDGCYTNVIGLPLKRTEELLRSGGFWARCVPRLAPPGLQNPTLSEE